MKNSTKIIRWYFAICANTFSRETSSLLPKVLQYSCFKKTPSFGLSSVIQAQYLSNPGPDMRFVKYFTPLDFQAKNVTSLISPNFNSLGDNNTKK